MKLHEYVDIDLLDYALVHGYVSKKDHPFATAYILNYTPKAQYERRWDDATLKCRGLIVDSSTEEIIARPFPKFFNYGELDRGMLPGGPIRVQEKMDGSLGVLYTEPVTGRLAIATRGSFTSDQAQHATWLLRNSYPDFQPLPGFTYLFEIIYPENRIVVDYGDMDDLILLDVIHNETGQSHLNFGPVRSTWPGPVAQEYAFRSLLDVVNSDEVAGEEGYVVHFFHTNERVKVKFSEYVRLHKLLTNVSSRTIWELMSTGKGVEEILDNVPDEYYQWVREESRRLMTEFNRIAGTTWRVFLNEYSRADSYPEGTREHRKEFAYLIRESDFKGILFSYYDDKPVDEAIWRLIKPAYSKPFWAQSEDVA